MNFSVRLFVSELTMVTELPWIAYICKEKTAVWTSPSQSTMHGAFGDRDASIPGTQFAVHFHQLYMENITCQLPKDMVHLILFHWLPTRLCNFSLLWLVMLHWPTEKPTIEPCFGLHRSDGPAVSHFPGWSSPKRSWNRENGRLESTVENPLKNRYRMMAFHGFPFNHKDFIGIHHHFPRSFPRS